MAGAAHGRCGATARLLAAAVLAGCVAGASDAAGQTVATDTSVTADAATELLRPGDVVRLSIWREESLSGDFPVSEKGIVVFPTLGPWKVTDVRPDSLRARLIAAYAHYLRNPSIDVRFLRRVTILGAVREAGLKLVDPTMTIAETLALAGGTTPEGAKDRVELIRDGKTVVVLDQRMRIAEARVRSGDQLYVPERGWASRNPGVLAALISGGVSIFVALLLR